MNTTLTSLPVDGSTGYASFTNDYSLITSETPLGTYTIPVSCGVIFVEDNAWIEGTVASKVTIAAADVVDPGVYPNIVLPNNILYAAFDGSDGLTAIASHNVLIGPNTPQNLTLDGIFIAQSGTFGRNLYDCNNPAYQYRGKLSMRSSFQCCARTIIGLGASAIADKAHGPAILIHYGHSYLTGKIRQSAALYAVYFHTMAVRRLAANELIYFRYAYRR